MKLSGRALNVMKAGAAYPFAEIPDEGLNQARLINLASNESPLGPPPSALKAIEREMGKLNLYPDPKSAELKRAIGEYLGVAPDCVAIGNGSDELVDLVCRALLDPGDEALIPIPTFAMYELSCLANGGSPRFFQLPNFGWPASELARELGEAELAFIPRPNNPTGNCIGLAGLRELLATGKPVVVDEAYAEFAGRSVARLAARRENLIVLRTFSKAFGLAGVRVGYAICNRDLASLLERMRAPFAVNRLAQAAAVAALRDRRYVRRLISLVRRERAYLRRELGRLGLLVFPSEANFLMVDVSPFGIDAPALCKFLAGRGILVRDLSGFRGAGPRYVRISVGTRDQNERLVPALREFKGGG